MIESRHKYINNSIVSSELEERIMQREHEQTHQDIQELQRREERVTKQWEQYASQFSTDSLSKEQTEVLGATRDFYLTLKKNLTKNDKIDICQTRKGNYSGDFFPHTLKENKLAIAWLEKVGDKQEELEGLFPNLFNEKLIPRKVERTPVNRVEGSMVNEIGVFQPVLVALSYCLHCETWGVDGLIGVKHHRPGMLNKAGVISIETVLYNISIVYSGDVRQPYSSITTLPKSNMQKYL